MGRKKVYDWTNMLPELKQICTDICKNIDGFLSSK